MPRPLARTPRIDHGKFQLLLDALLRRIQKDFGEESYSLTALQTKFDSFAKPSMSDTERCAALVKAAVAFLNEMASFESAGVSDKA